VILIYITEVPDRKYVPLGPAIRALRHHRELTLVELGALCGLSHPLLSQIESGHTRGSIRSIEKIANALGVRVPQLWMIEADHPLQ
jgi:transcriptional regulator with XRE-family HTH domain